MVAGIWFCCWRAEVKAAARAVAVAGRSVLSFSMQWWTTRATSGDSSGQSCSSGGGGFSMWLASSRATASETNGGRPASIQ